MRFFWLLAIVLPFSLFAQVTDSAMFIPMITGTYSLQVPGGDLSDRFGISSDIGASFDMKFKSGWVLGAECTYLFGNKIKEDQIFSHLVTSQGDLINRYGDYASTSLTERGFRASGRLGKVFTIGTKNPNSGILATAGVGLLQHKIWIEVEGNNTPQIMDPYRKGYDRLTNGLMLTQFVGYMYFSETQFFNAYVGFEFVEGFTQDRRSWNFDTMEQDTNKRLDLLYALKFGWIFPLYKKAPDKFYMY